MFLWCNIVVQQSNNNKNNMEGTKPLITSKNKKSNNNMDGTPPLRGVPYPTF